MMPRLAAALAAPLLLAGCHSAPPAINLADQPDETTVEDAEQNEQANLAAEITNEARTADANDDQDDAVTHYACDNGMTVDATYGDDGNAQLTINGKPYALAGIPAASGGKYRIEAGPTAGKSLIWWTKSDNAMLIQAPRRAPEGSPKETVANCLETEAAPQ